MYRAESLRYNGRGDSLLVAVRAVNAHGEDIGAVKGITQDRTKGSIQLQRHYRHFVLIPAYYR